MNKNEPILIACEESGVVTSAFIKRGFTNVFSCDLNETTGCYSNRHIVGDVMPIINGKCSFKTSDGINHKIDTEFSLIIAFPPCTHLAVSGARHFAEKQKDGRQQDGIDFFMEFVNCKCEKVAIENPIGIMSTKYKNPTQIIQPYYFGDAEVKTTCLWLKNLPMLIHIKEENLFNEKITHVTPEYIIGKRTLKKYSRIHYETPSRDRSRIRSKTFNGIANAMAEQWG